jgi:hypothetical protein
LLFEVGEPVAVVAHGAGDDGVADPEAEQRDASGKAGAAASGLDDIAAGTDGGRAHTSADDGFDDPVESPEHEALRPRRPGPDPLPPLIHGTAPLLDTI